LAQIFVQSDSTLTVNLDFNHVGSHRPQFGSSLFAAFDGLSHFFSPGQRLGDSDHADAFVLPKDQITAGFQTVSEGRWQRDSTLGVELTLIPSNETFH
jgi:hypothetical protein